MVGMDFQELSFDLRGLSTDTRELNDRHLPQPTLHAMFMRF